MTFSFCIKVVGFPFLEKISFLKMKWSGIFRKVEFWMKWNSLIPLTGKQCKMKEHREKSPIPFFLQTSLSLSYLLHNSMLKELFGKALKCKNKKQEARRKNKLNRKKWKGNLSTVLNARQTRKKKKTLNRKN